MVYFFFISSLLWAECPRIKKVKKYALRCRDDLIVWTSLTDWHRSERTQVEEFRFSWHEKIISTHRRRRRRHRPSRVIFTQNSHSILNWISLHRWRAFLYPKLEIGNVSVICKLTDGWHSGQPALLWLSGTPVLLPSKVFKLKAILNWILGICVGIVHDNDFIRDDDCF